ncbi:hypothetical protein IAU60_005472 [Kwoniella sp. DSM 27419]
MHGDYRGVNPSTGQGWDRGGYAPTAPSSHLPPPPPPPSAIVPGVHVNPYAPTVGTVYGYSGDVSGSRRVSVESPASRPASSNYVAHGDPRDTRDRPPPSGPSSAAPPPRPSSATSIPAGPSTREYRPRQTSDKTWSRDQSPAVSVSSGSGAPREREVLAGKEGSVAGALEEFTKAMHTTLTSTSIHSLALSHFTRLAKFPQTDPTSPSFEDAQKRVQEAEKALNQHMITLQMSFTELMRRAVGKVGQEGGVGNLEIDVLKERLRKLEQAATTSIVPPPPILNDVTPVQGPSMAQAAMPAVPDLATRTSAKNDSDPATRGRLKALLKDISDRLHSVEDFKDAFDSRIDTVETVVMNWELDEVEPPKKRIYGWGQLEDARDPTGRLRGLKRPRRDDTTTGETDIVDVDPEVDMSVDDSGAMDDGSADKEQLALLQKQITALTSDIVDLKAETTAGAATQAQSGGNATGQPLEEEVAALQTRIKALEDQLPAVKDRLVVSAAADTSTVPPNQTSSLQGETQAAGGSNQTTDPNTPPPDMTKIHQEIAAIKSTYDQIKQNIERVMAQRASPLATVSLVTETLRKRDSEWTESKSRQAGSAGVEQQSQTDALKREVDALRDEVKLFKEDHARRAEQDRSTLASMEALQAELQGLRQETKAMRDGREEWTKEVMRCCLSAVKEENDANKEEYSKIVRGELAKLAKEHMMKRSMSVTGSGSRSTSEPADEAGNTSPGIQPSSTLPVPPQRPNGSFSGAALPTPTSDTAPQSDIATGQREPNQPTQPSAPVPVTFEEFATNEGRR